MKKNELILSVRDLNIKFNLRGKILHAIRGIDLDVYHGEVLAIVGESGSGKSVFTKSFMGCCWTPTAPSLPAPSTTSVPTTTSPSASPS